MICELEVIGMDKKKYRETIIIPAYVRKADRFDYAEKKFLKKYRKEPDYIDSSRITCASDKENIRN